MTLTYHRAARRMRCHYCNYCGDGAASVRGVWRRHFSSSRDSEPSASRSDLRRAVSRRPDRARRSRHGSPARRDCARPSRDGARRDRRARRHADDCEGTRFPGRHARRRGVGGRRPRLRRFPGGRAHVSVAHAGRRPRRPRRRRRASAIIQTLYPDHYSVSAAAEAGLRDVLRSRTRVPARAPVPAGGRRSSTSS